MNCSRCGAASPDGVKYCGECGAAMGHTCLSCGELNATGNRFCSNCGSALTEFIAEIGPERRQVCVMFCDLVDSVRWSRALDPEDWLRVLREYQDCVGKHINDHRGRVTRYLGDGILAIFGYPVATESDAELAVRAALTIAEAVPQLNVPRLPPPYVHLQVRIAIATGESVVGNIVGERGAEERAVVGGTPNLAARLQQHATPNTVVSDNQTRELIGDLFECEDLGLHELKGFANPTRVWKVVGASQHESLFRASHGYPLTTLVDREEDLELLTRRWNLAAGGLGQVVVLGGEPGIGKSRIAEGLHERIGQSGKHLVYQCSPMHTNSALSPILTQLQYAAKLSSKDSDADKWEKLGDTLAGSDEERRNAHLLMSNLLGIEPPPSLTDAIEKLDPPERRRRFFDAFRKQLRALSAVKPLLVVFEDVQWIDPTSLELLNLVINEVQRLPILVVITHRLEFNPPWAELPHVTMETVRRLPEDDVKTMIKRVRGGEELSIDLVEQVAKRTDGIPLFIEELVAAIVTSKSTGLLGTRKRPDEGSIPSTLKGSLTARLDALAEARKLAQVASVIGREFTYSLLCLVVDWTEQQLRELLGRLVNSGLVFAQGTSPDSTYVFKHALVRDVAYGTLLRSQRQQYHLRIAKAIESRFPELAHSNPEVVAQHYTWGDDMENAVCYWLKAGQRAAAGSQNVEATAHLTTGLRLLRRLPRTEANLRRELEFLVSRGPAMLTTRGAATHRVRRNYDRALELCEQLDESELHFAAYWGSLRIDESYTSKLERVEGLERLSNRLKDPGYVLQAHHRQWATLFHLARHAECLQHIRDGLALYDQGDYRDHGTKYAGHDPKVCAHGEAALSLWLLGRPGDALHEIDQAIDWAKTLNHSGSIGHALDIASMLHRYRRNVPSLELHAAEMKAFGERHHMVEHVSKAGIFLAWAMAKRGRIDEALATLGSELDNQVKSNTPEDFPVFFDSHAEVLGLAGRFADALSVNRDAFDIAETNDIFYWSAELHRCRGELLRLEGKASADPVTCFDQAIAVAREQGARSLELRAALSLGRYWRDRKETSRARSALETVLTSCDPTMDSVDLREARDLVAHLR